MQVDPWSVIADLVDIRRLSTRVHEINLSFQVAIEATQALLAEETPPDDDQTELLDQAEKAVFEYWMFTRIQLRKHDKIYPSPTRKEMTISNTLLPWLLMSHLHLFRVLYDHGPGNELATQSAKFMVWKRKTFALDILRNAEGAVVCETAPCKMTPQEIQSIFYVLTSRWREFHYAHHERIYEYMLMMIRRMFVMSVIESGTLPEGQDDPLQLFTSKRRFVLPPAMIYEFEMHAHTLMYNFSITTLFTVMPFCEWPGFNETDYRRTKFRCTRFLRIRMANNKFDALRSEFSSDITNRCARPTQREREARIRGRKTESISSREFLANEEAQENKLREYLSEPNLVHRTVQGQIGTLFSRQYLFCMIFDKFLSINYEWEFIQESVYKESGLVNTKKIKKLSQVGGLPFLFCVCNTYMLVLNGVLYPVSHFLDAMTQFILVTRNGERAFKYPGFYREFLDLEGYEPTQAELQSVSIDHGVFSTTLTDINAQGFETESDSDGSDSEIYND
ncbi:MAG: hypothetical protein CMP20_15335 [Rickettsiales bacterium]|nr:hypothetical protein [Rickettsiales bacterium]